MADRLSRKELLTATSLLACLIAGRDSLAQEQASPDARLSEVTWSKAGTYVWNRPEHVRFILVRACGGGGGGGGGFSIFPRPEPRADGGTAAGGGGGAGATVSTILLGPLTDASYTIVIGHGGAGAASTNFSSHTARGSFGQPGTATSFTGQDLSFETPGAAGGLGGSSSTRMSEDATSYKYVVTKAESSGPAYPGGGSAQNGARGLLGLGGVGSVAGDSGGGGGSIGKGGSGGAINGAGEAGGNCAGGGGAGYPQNDAGRAPGGNGGDGSLTLLSMTSAPGSR